MAEAPPDHDCGPGCALVAEGGHVAVPVSSFRVIYDAAQAALRDKGAVQALDHAAALATINPRCYYALARRRQAMQDGRVQPDSELHFTRLLLAGKGVKASELWAHHAAALHGALLSRVPAAAVTPLCPGAAQRAGSAEKVSAACKNATVGSDPGPVADALLMLEQECNLCRRAATTHKRLYYAWRHRLAVQRALLSLGTHISHGACQAVRCVLRDLDAVEEWVRLRPSDHSAWHHRIQVLIDLSAALHSHWQVPDALLCALWGRELALHAYVAGAHPGHSGQRSATRSLVLAARSTLCSESSVASESPLPASLAACAASWRDAGPVELGGELAIAAVAAWQGGAAEAGAEEGVLGHMQGWLRDSLLRDWAVGLDGSERGSASEALPDS